MTDSAETKIIIAVDGHYLNVGLAQEGMRRSAGNPNRAKVRLDFRALKTILSPEAWKSGEEDAPETVFLDYYIGFPLVPNVKGFSTGTLVQWNGKFGRIINIDDESLKFFVHHSDVNVRDWRDFREHAMVRFLADENEKGGIARSVYLGSELAKLRESQNEREFFLKMLEDYGYNVIQCRPNPHNPLSKSHAANVQMAFDIGSTAEKGDKVIFLTGDPNFASIIGELRDDGIKVMVAGFRNSISHELLSELKPGELLDLSNVLEKIEYSPENNVRVAADVGGDE